jgi:hypothetical protein
VAGEFQAASPSRRGAIAPRKFCQIELISINGAASGRLYKPSTNTLERF